MATTYITKQNETIDYICYKYYGSTANNQVEIVLRANPGLEQQNIILDLGLSIYLPDIALAKTPVAKIRKLWQ